jgi:hypothetical protein
VIECDAARDIHERPRRNEQSYARPERALRSLAKRSRESLSARSGYVARGRRIDQHRGGGLRGSRLSRLSGDICLDATTMLPICVVRPVSMLLFLL